MANETNHDLSVSIARIQTGTLESNRRLERIEKVLEDQNLILTAVNVLQNKVETNERRIADLERSRSWAARIVVGAVMSGIIGFFVLKPTIAKAAISLLVLMPR